jgi:hypothetical protein
VSVELLSNHWLRIALSILIAAVVILSIVEFQKITGSNEDSTDIPDSEFFSIGKVSSGSFEVIVHDTPQGRTTLSCVPYHWYDRLNPQYQPNELLYKPMPGELNLSSFDPDDYDEESLPHNAIGATIITGFEDVVFKFDTILHDSIIRCSLLDSSEEYPVIQTSEVIIARAEGQHNPIVNVTMTNDWDGLTLHWESDQTATWFRSKSIFLDGSDYSTPTTTVDQFSQTHEPVSHSRYIGGIAEGKWIISVFGGDGDGYIEYVTWYEFEYNGRECESPDTCKEEVEMTPYATLEWPL